MPKNRMVNTIFWEDNYTANLDPVEKLLFLYFLTNSSTSICGIYQITIKKVAVETGIDREMVEKVLRRFTDDGRIFYEDGWVGIKNFTKHQNQKSPKIKKGIKVELENVPKSIRKLVFGKGIDTLSHLNSNLNSNSNSNSKPNTKDILPLTGVEVNEVIKLFEKVNPSYEIFFKRKNQRDALQRLLKKHGREKIERVIDVLPKTNQQQYAPTITSPCQLEDKLASLISFLQKKKITSNVVKL